MFWDVFIARSQKMGPRNPDADAYVEVSDLISAQSTSRD